jgi:hypothetical protein
MTGHIHDALNIKNTYTQSTAEKRDEQWYLKPHKQRRRDQRLHKAIHERGLATFENAVTRMDLHVPRQDVDNQGRLPRHQTVRLHESVRPQIECHQQKTPGETRKPSQDGVVEQITLLGRKLRQYERN